GGAGDTETPRFGYARDYNANQYYLERKLIALECGAREDENHNGAAGPAKQTEMDCLVAGCGTAAINAAFFTLLSAGDHIVCSNPCYYSVHKFLLDHLSGRFGVEVTFADATDPEKIKAAVKPNTKIIHVETPGNPITCIADIAAISAIAKGAGALLTVDGTWASPILQRPLLLGADLVMHSLSKYINGHGDSLGGAVIGRKDLIDRIRVEGCVRLGQPISPFNAWLISRGAATLPLRMAAHCESAMRIAAFLESHPAVLFVRYPGLMSHPQHETAKRQMSGFSGMLNLRLKGGIPAHEKFIGRLRLFLNAVSLGHNESLIVHHRMNKDDPWFPILKETAIDAGEAFMRISVGLEDAEDLIADIEQAIGRIG
ncbi:MAG: aminotransferase class I/II-fold pyridoxal phosphate-dependent enzyme, partial [Defluviitaleaceae bacterium]|nr:aminotransferase class I/II-fold pyridoxal phosphate-dependent enzyme [Defluviitaleaceae bacterium]